MKIKNSFITSSLILLTIFITESQTYGQKIKPIYNDETQEVTIDGKYYIMMQKSGGGNAGLSKNYSIQNKEGDEIVYMKFVARTKYNYSTKENETSYWYKISFSETGSWFWLSKSILGMSQKGAMKILVKNELIKDGNLNWDMAKRYLQNNNGKIALPKPKGPSSNQVIVNSNQEIIQDGVLIGKVMERHTDIDHTYHVFDKTGSKVMVASKSIIDPFEWKLTTPEGKTYNVIYEGEKDGIRILTYMASKGWLK